MEKLYTVSKNKLRSFKFPWAACNVGDPGLIPELGRFPQGREWLPTPVFRPGESRDGGAWWAAVYGVELLYLQLPRI